ncbi:NADH-quinone oxidoreductase subunit N [Phycicoccus sp. BSK3Z-2]|uniref:NADH-quinone oxidoreductase subunit N n=1 Tax=Phycicoccus avicenniae TaxID=2828860 RepID=A0A941D5D5_9MICO|nr:proton-conducting transporter membrane subunit [Phycicoccus avicenniae]MBR7742419.1 NADH-quinone oxidoreductase subunit N [Phycicoccus avicenniae]
MEMRPLAMLPEILLLAGGLVCLLGGSFTPRRRQWRLRVVAAGALLAALVAALVGSRDPGPALEGAVVVDGLTTGTRVVVALATLAVLLLAEEEVRDDDRESETYALMLLAATGALVLGGARDLLVLAAAFLLASIPLYGLVGLRRTDRGAEAALKTYLTGAVFGILLLLGTTLVYGLAGTTRLPDLAARLATAPAAPLAVGVVCVVAGLAFKAGAVPAHFWVPDAAQGAGGHTAAFVTTIPKVGAVVALYRLVTALPETLPWGLLVAVLAVASMTLGNLAAFGQDDPRRLLGWSTVSQVGYLLVPVAVAGRTSLAAAAMLLYLAAYAVTNVVAFAVTTALPDVRDLAGYAGLGRGRPALAASLVVALLGLVGTPPTAVFVGKLAVATAAWDGGMPWLSVALLANTLVSLFYYLRWVAPVLRQGDPDVGPPVTRPWSTGAATGLAVLTLVGAPAAGILWCALGGTG